MARAQHLVATSGTCGMKVTLLLITPSVGNPTTTVGRYIVLVLDRRGYHASLQVVGNPYPRMGDSRDHVQIAWFPWYQDYPAPSDFISPLFTCRGFLPGNPNNINDSEFCDPRIDAEIQRASSLQALAPGAASETWRAVDQQITDHAPSLPLYNPRIDIATSSRVGNYQYQPFFVLLFDQLWVR
jgi:peptide/nickel transport system substrate-binding protein